jgi:hypothetical protein
MVEKHLFGQRRALSERKRLKHLIFLAGQMDRTPAEIDSLSVQIDGYFPGFDHRLRVAFGATDDCVDTRKKFLAMEWLAQIVVHTEAQTPNFILRVVGACENHRSACRPGKGAIASELPLLPYPADSNREKYSRNHRAWQDRPLLNQGPSHGRLNSRVSESSRCSAKLLDRLQLKVRAYHFSAAIPSPVFNRRSMVNWGYQILLL